tara:strand:- start:489 stop:968 length:480 start_codon:yes stop_codon:yes gene_type:complete
MSYKFLLISTLFLALATACKDATKEDSESIVPAETRATIEYNENQLDTIPETNDEVSFRGDGTEPFWNIEFKNGRMHFKAMDADLQSFVAPIPEPEILGNAKKYTASSKRVIMEVLITEGECINAMSGKKSTFKVKVSIKPVSQEKFNVYEGCGASNSF